MDLGDEAVQALAALLDGYQEEPCLLLQAGAAAYAPRTSVQKRLQKSATGLARTGCLATEQSALAGTHGS
jgi:hypothetical protein